MKNHLASATLLAAAWPLSVLAHEGHGQPGTAHWHATDVLGFALALAIVAGMAWWNKRK